MMILEVITQQSETKPGSYKAKLDEFEDVYTHIHNAEYTEAKALAYKKITEGCLDVRYAMYVIFGNWYESVDFDVNSQLINELILIHEFYLEKANTKTINKKQYIATVKWLHERLYEHALFIKSTSKKTLSGEKKNLHIELGKYIDFITENLSELESSKLYQLQQIWDGFAMTPIPTIERSDIEIEEKALPQTTKNTIKISQVQPSPSHDIKADATGNTKWDRLLKNISIYTNLVKQEEWLKAAIVHKKISGEISRFDPIEYFPEVFYPYLQSTANSFNLIMEKEQYSQSAVWSILEQMYESCPDSFAQVNSITNSSAMFQGENDISKEPSQNYSKLNSSDDSNDSTYSQEQNEEHVDSSW